MHEHDEDKSSHRAPRKGPMGLALRMVGGDDARSRDCVSVRAWITPAAVTSQWLGFRPLFRVFFCTKKDVLQPFR